MNVNDEVVAISLLFACSAGANHYVEKAKEELNATNLIGVLFLLGLGIYWSIIVWKDLLFG